MCQAVRAPGSKLTRPERTRAGAGASMIGSCQTMPVKDSFGWRRVGTDPSFNGKFSVGEPYFRQLLFDFCRFGRVGAGQFYFDLADIFIRCDGRIDAVIFELFAHLFDHAGNVPQTGSDLPVQQRPELHRRVLVGPDDERVDGSETRRRVRKLGERCRRR